MKHNRRSSLKIKNKKFRKEKCKRKPKLPHVQNKFPSIAVVVKNGKNKRSKHIKPETINTSSEWNVIDLNIDASSKSDEFDSDGQLSKKIKRKIQKLHKHTKQSDIIPMTTDEDSTTMGSENINLVNKYVSNYVKNMFNPIIVDVQNTDLNTVPMTNTLLQSNLKGKKHKVKKVNIKKLMPESSDIKETGIVDIQNIDTVPMKECTASILLKSNSKGKSKKNHKVKKVNTEKPMSESSAFKETGIVDVQNIGTAPMKECKLLKSNQKPKIKVKIQKPNSKNTDFEETGSKSKLQSKESKNKVFPENKIVVTKVSSQIKENENFVENLGFKFYLKSNYCVILLPKRLRLYFNGKFKVTPLYGETEIFGYLLKHPVNVYSPKGNSFLYFKNTGGSNNINNINSLPKDLLKQISNEINENENKLSVIKLEYFENTVTKFLKAHTDQQLYPKKHKSENQSLENIIKEKLNCQFYYGTEDQKLFEVNHSWKKIINEIKQNEISDQKLIICGGKRVGKSTFLRFSVNMFLESNQEVLCLDFDPGQSEFFVPGCITATVIKEPLIGPNYTHLSHPDLCMFIGNTDISQCVNRYIDSINHLINFCNAELRYKNMPWVVNTMGFTHGLGTEIMIYIIKKLKPLHLIQIKSRSHRLNYPFELHSDFVASYEGSLPLIEKDLKYKLHIIDSVVFKNNSSEWNIEPRQIREMCILAYLGQMLQMGMEVITDVQPYVCSIKSINMVNLNYNVSDTLLMGLFNGKLVALCTNTEQKNDSLWICVGFGVVRGFDITNEEIYLLTPLSLKELREVKSIVLGNIDLPANIYMSHVKTTGIIPYVSKSLKNQTSQVPKRCFYKPIQLFKKINKNVNFE